MAEWTLCLEGVVPPAVLFPNAARRLHYHQRAAATGSLRQAACLAAMAARGNDHPSFTGPVTVRVTVRWPRGRRMPDVDALALAVKPVLDGLTDAGIWADDRQIAEACYRQERDPGGAGMIIVTVQGGEA